MWRNCRTVRNRGKSVGAARASEAGSSAPAGGAPSCSSASGTGSSGASGGVKASSAGTCASSAGGVLPSSETSLQSESRAYTSASNTAQLASLAASMTNQLPKDAGAAALDEGACEAPPATLTESAPASSAGAGWRLARNWGKSRSVVYVRLTSCERIGEAVRKILCNFLAFAGRITSAASCLSKAMVVLPVPERPTTMALPGAPAFFSSSLSRSPPMRSKS
mmetsp:Transcript_28564/g.68692  ORF Transcript_28564/g.68692 Transcript_28564/m.68692 type:complete len:222 (-) Transcript_28564:858-1523(-)